MSSIYDMDEKTRNYINEINKEIDKKQNKVFKILLKITQGIKDETLDKEKQKELFNDIDILKKQIEENSNRIKEVKANPELIFEGISNNLSPYENVNSIYNDEINTEDILNTIDELTKTLKSIDDTKIVKEKKENCKKYSFIKKNRNGMLNYEEKNAQSNISLNEKQKKNFKSGRGNELVVIDEESLSYKIKNLFSKFERLLKKK